VPEPHNLFLAVWLETGFIGLLAFLGLLFRALKNAWLWREEKSTALFGALLIGTLTYGLFDTPLFGNGLAYIFWLNMGALLFLTGKE
jgi:O-antigen ligase